MIKSQFVCEKCKREWPLPLKYDEVQACWVGVVVRFGEHNSPASSGTNFGTSVLREAVWCRECLLKCGVEQPRGSDAKPQTTRPADPSDLLVQALEQLGFKREE